MKHRGRGLASIEYPTGMNQGGDPSQAWIKMKPDGHVDVFAGTVDLVHRGFGGEISNAR